MRTDIVLVALEGRGPCEWDVIEEHGFMNGQKPLFVMTDEDMLTLAFCDKPFTKAELEEVIKDVFGPEEEHV